ncbi:MAG: cytochrome c oxidase assembly protein [Candidatus Dormibacteria bacterium]
MNPLPLHWVLEPTIVLPMLAATLAFFLDQRSRPAAPGRKPTLFALGMLAFVVALVTPLDFAADRYLLSAHMIQHILITMIGPALLLAALPDADPRGRWGRLPGFLVNPWTAVFLFNAVLLTWHLPALYQATLVNEGVHIFEHVTFVTTAAVFWWPITGPTARRGAGMAPLMKVGYLALAGIPPTVIGMVLAIAPNVLYPFYATAPRLFPSISAELDQQVAGILMFGLGNLIYFVPLTRNFLQLLDEQEAAAT